MTGVVKSVGKYALLTGSALALSISAATAASMTDAGLEKRVSDLEREVALLKNRLKTAKSCDCSRMVRSGNSRVKVTLYGQVNRAFRVAFSSSDTQTSHVDSDGSSSRLGFLARGRLSPDLTISARIEVEWQENRRSATRDATDGNVRVRARHVDLWLDHKDLGQLWMGHGSIAGDAAHLFSISGTSYVFSFGGAGGDDGLLAAQGGSQVAGRHGFFTFFGARQNRIMYVTPNIMGFRVRVSHGEQDSVSVGIRYSGNPFGMKDFRAIMAAGYVNNPGRGASSPANTGAGNANGYGVSGGILHVPTGLNISAAWALLAGHNATRNVHGNPHMFAVEGGWTGKIWAMGATNVTIGYAIWHHQSNVAPGTVGIGTGRTYRYWFAVNQNLDQAASDVYLGISYDDGQYNGAGREGVVVVLTGIRIRF